MARRGRNPDAYFMGVAARQDVVAASSRIACDPVLRPSDGGHRNHGPCSTALPRNTRAPPSKDKKTGLRSLRETAGARGISNSGASGLMGIPEPCAPHSSGKHYMPFIGMIYLSPSKNFHGYARQITADSRFVK